MVVLLDLSNAVAGAVAGAVAADDVNGRGRVLESLVVVDRHPALRAVEARVTDRYGDGNGNGGGDYKEDGGDSGGDDSGGDDSFSDSRLRRLREAGVKEVKNGRGEDGIDGGELDGGEGGGRGGGERGTVEKDMDAVDDTDDDGGNMDGSKEPQRPNPNINNFSASLGCYPIVSQLTQSLDLNTLHALSITCRQFRANLLPFRRQLVSRSLRCSNEIPPRSSNSSRGVEVSSRVRETVEGVQRPWRVIGERQVEVGRRLTTGKIGRCARDMVGECRRCGKVVCRNCTIKPPSSPTLKDRHRRLCPTCIEAPLSAHTSPHPTTVLSSKPAFTTEAFLRTPCTCPIETWLCQPCGVTLRSADTTYARVWTWRTRYSTYLGGLGTGIGEGHEGVKCGRGDACLAAKDIEVEIDCDADELAALQRELEEEGRRNGVEGPCYLRQEIEGIGGVVKKKVRKRMRVGAVVVEHEDERETGEYLTQEAKGDERSWCGWCARVIPGAKDLESDTGIQ